MVQTLQIQIKEQANRLADRQGHVYAPTNKLVRKLKMQLIHLVKHREVLLNSLCILLCLGENMSNNL